VRATSTAPSGSRDERQVPMTSDRRRIVAEVRERRDGGPGNPGCGRGSVRLLLVRSEWRRGPGRLRVVSVRWGNPVPLVAVIYCNHPKPRDDADDDGPAARVSVVWCHHGWATTPGPGTCGGPRTVTVADAFHPRRRGHRQPVSRAPSRRWCPGVVSPLRGPHPHEPVGRRPCRGWRVSWRCGGSPTPGASPPPVRRGRATHAKVTGSPQWVAGVGRRRRDHRMGGGCRGRSCGGCALGSLAGGAGAGGCVGCGAGQLPRPVGVVPAGVALGVVGGAVRVGRREAGPRARAAGGTRGRVGPPGASPPGAVPVV
jgi:hypothetical protein